MAISGLQGTLFFFRRKKSIDTPPANITSFLREEGRRRTLEDLGQSPSSCLDMPESGNSGTLKFPLLFLQLS